MKILIHETGINRVNIDHKLFFLKLIFAVSIF